ncbi:hypothetical protein RIF29_15506 [Crotalaria pallida]|uniref:SWIM-type domain-containing protein n=1 Tax=Crotalaria pallida TaxID=3830 RepID=A0AAN9IDM5_CROPI
MSEGRCETVSISEGRLTISRSEDGNSLHPEINAAESSDGCSSKNICQDGLEDNESMALSENEFVNENSDDGECDLADFFRLDNSEDIGSICFEMLRRSEMIQFHFKSLGIAYEFYNEYARATVFSVRKNKSYYGSLGDVVWKSFVCSREGLRRENNKDIEDESGRESRAITFGCKAEFRVRVDKSSGPWTVIHFEDKHNHEVFSDRFAGRLKSHNKMSEADIAKMNSMREVGIGIPKIFGLAGHLSRGYGNIGYKRKQMYNQLIKQRQQQEGDAHATLRLLELVRHFEHCLNYIRNNEVEADLRSLDGIPVLKTSVPSIELFAAKVYTRAIFYKFREVLLGLGSVYIDGSRKTSSSVIFAVNKFSQGSRRSQRNVSWFPSTNEFKCSCQGLQSKGYPCVHIICVLVKLQIHVLPESLIWNRWRINAKEGLDQNVQQGGGCDQSNRLNRITSLKRCARRLFSIAGRSLEDYHEIRELLNANADILLSNNQSTVNVGESGRNCSDQHVKDPTRVRTKGCGTYAVILNLRACRTLKMMVFDGDDHSLCSCWLGFSKSECMAG